MNRALCCDREDGIARAAILLICVSVAPASAQLRSVVVSPAVRVSEPGSEWWSATVELDERPNGARAIVVSAMTDEGLQRARGVWPRLDEWAFAGPGSFLQAAQRRTQQTPLLTNVPTFLGFSDDRAFALSTVMVGPWRTILIGGGSRAGVGVNDGLPFAIYTDDGSDWKPDPGVAIPTPLRIGDVTVAAPVVAHGAGRGDTPVGVDRQQHLPSVAVRPVAGDSDEVYVAFCARASRASANTDVYIARSIGTETSLFAFPPPSAASFFHVSDTFLGTPTGTDGADQFVPAIAIDSCGGVNLMFYDNRHDPDRTDSVELVDVYYARIANYGTGTEWVYQQRLTPQSIRVDNLGGNRFLGDYHNLTVSPDGKTIYAAYISRDNADPVAGDRTCYVHRIDINCSGPLAEMTGDGSVTEADAVAFASAWAAGEPEADTNLDMTVDADDLVNYLITYSEEIE